MEIKIHAFNFKLGDKQEMLVREKITKLENLASRLADTSAEARVDITLQSSKKTEELFSCHLTLFVPGDTLRAEAQDESLENAVDDVVSKIKGQIEKYKAKSQHINEHK